MILKPIKKGRPPSCHPDDLSYPAAADFVKNPSAYVRYWSRKGHGLQLMYDPKTGKRYIVKT
ncbi:MAG: hypothetical protein KatS3mg031_2971 [Chitinophagales bacterium]|nr:MAG: hypothetical protein KatS3mg031_2971 [Chitinophagales bacterium]